MSSYLSLAFVLLALGVLTAAAAVTAMAFALLRPPRMTDGKAVWVLRRISPADLGLGFEDISFNIRDEQTGQPLRIAGWWMPHPKSIGKCVVLLHGYADAKVGSIAWAPVWQSLGYDVLAIDLRAHGESGGVYCTAGFWERHDLCQVLGQFRAEHPAAKELVLFGVSLGAATAAATAALRNDIAAVVLESPPADFRNAAMAHMEHLGAPGRLFQKLALWLAGRLARCEFAEVRPMDLLSKIPCPVMIIAPDDDPMVSDAERSEIKQALDARGGAPQDVYWPVSTGHMLAIQAHRAGYEEQLRNFLGALKR
ncbi:MAG TPA: alpha/beta fold hydrolase [Bryobacteraceae bacterium]|jgi:hypothetical protein|nr:alpha/beta fold hydrolase [Bryobacteraceae bacterium]